MAVERASWETQPASETAAQRYARDVETRGGDWSRATLSAGADPTWTPTGDSELVLDADGRIDREYLRRGGDFYLDGAGDTQYDADGRNDREYADGATLVSAITDAAFADAADLEGSPL